MERVYCRAGSNSSTQCYFRCIIDQSTSPAPPHSQGIIHHSSFHRDRFHTTTAVYLLGWQYHQSPRLVDRINAGEFIDMAKLLPDHMGTINPSSTDESARQKVRWCPVTSIIKWMQCFNVYLSVICRTCPERILDLFDLPDVNH